MKTYLTTNILFTAALSMAVFNSCTHSATVNKDSATATDSAKEAANDSSLLKKYAPGDLKTDFSKHSVPMDKVFDGGVHKNAIPAIDFPEFVGVEEAHAYLSDPDFGILLEHNGEQKFYPLAILNWHEIVNDVIDDHPVAVTFCPLCGSTIVYDRLMDGDTLLFGVSGRLYESNLLMFDEKTESLWSQAMGECVVGQMLGKKLKLVNSSLISYEEVEKYYPDARVLSLKTGYDRNYTRDPYSQYLADDSLMFPVSVRSKMFLNKDEMYVVETDKNSVAFHWKDLLKAGSATQQTPDGTVQVTITHYVPVATLKESGTPLNGYFTYWFSWYAAKGKQGGIIWKK